MAIHHTLRSVILSVVFVFTFYGFINAQTAAVRGFVYEEATGEPVMFANVYLKGTTQGSTTDINGYFSITQLKPDDYTLVVTFLGYDTINERITLKNNEVLTKRLNMKENSVKLATVTIRADKIEAQTETRTSVINITPKTLTKIPSIGGQSDIAQYLQVVPGVIFTGDQGGQLYIRGGSPIQNKVLLDGMVIYNPFHSIGLFSVFDTDIIRNAEVFTGGFGAEYGGRISSVMDITTRDGNKNRFSGKIGASTFGAKAMIEGPIVKQKTKDSGSASFILSVKNSYLEQTSTSIYDYVNDEEGLPFNFLDIYGKVSINASNGSKVNFFGFRFDDKVNNYQALSDFGWNSVGGGTNFILIPGKSSVLIEGHFAYSNYEAYLEEENTPRRSSGISGFNGGFNFTYFLGKNTLKYGIEVLGFKTEFDFANANGIKINQTENTTELGAFVKYKGTYGKLIYEPGFRVQWYASLSDISPEPRLALKYSISDNIRLKGAAGMYSQNLIAANNDRDVVNLFYGFLSGPDNLSKKYNGEEIKHKLQKANHYVLGVEFDLGYNLTFNVEGYLKDFTQLTNLNHNKIYDEYKAPLNTPDIEKKEFIIEKGKAYGGDISLKYEYGPWYVWAVYALGYVTREYEKEVGVIETYDTHYDRRHNVNIIVSYTLGDKHQWEFSGRWNFGSGFPFTQVAGYAEHIPFNDGIGSDYTTANGTIGVIYGEMNKGRMPTTHRLDLDVKRRFYFSEHTTLEINASVTNVYDRKNIFYVDMLKGNKDGVVYQLPIMPSIGMTLSF
ncbi:MAG: TonB-dependent receptor [Lentimicrobiaceae bacterium]|jgi:hypothetical protein|nr:TonB-dependent receptor [Lentimicrobiaceae bacterium]